MGDPPKRRPGGRSAAVRDAVLTAALIELEGGAVSVSLPDLAARAGVASSSIYRRWGTWEAVVADALLAGSDEAIAVPDSGSLRGDLVTYLTAVAAYLATPRGHALARAAAVTSASDSGADAVREAFWKARYEAALPMLRRARERGELSMPPVGDLLLIELAIAPLHLRRLVTGGDVRADIEARVDLLLQGVR